MVDLKEGSLPTEPTYINVVYDANKTPAETWLVREMNGYQIYALVREPHARPFTRVSLMKVGSLQPIKDDWDSNAQSFRHLKFR